MYDGSYQVAQDFLAQHNVLSLATCSGDKPWVAQVFYAIWSGRLIFLSASHTRHCRNIDTNPYVAASIGEDYSNWTAIKGFQLQGLVRKLSGRDVATAIDTYTKKFPVTGPDAPAEIANALERISWFSLEVSEIHFVDNSRGLGHRDQLDVNLLFAD